MSLTEQPEPVLAISNTGHDDVANLVEDAAASTSHCTHLQSVTQYRNQQ